MIYVILCVYLPEMSKYEKHLITNFYVAFSSIGKAYRFSVVSLHILMSITIKCCYN